MQAQPRTLNDRRRAAGLAPIPPRTPNDQAFFDPTHPIHAKIVSAAPGTGQARPEDSRGILAELAAELYPAKRSGRAVVDANPPLTLAELAAELYPAKRSGHAVVDANPPLTLAELAKELYKSSGSAVQ